MGRQFELTQERRLQPLQHRVYKTTKTTKTMAPTRNHYSLRSKGSSSKDLPTQEVANPAVPNDDADVIEVQVPPTTSLLDRFQPLISIEQLSAALEEQRLAFTRQLSMALEEQRTAFVRQHEAFKAEIATLISTQLSNVYVPPPMSTTSYAAIAQRSPPQGSTQTIQLRNQPSNSATRASIMSDTPYCTIDTSGVEQSKQQEAQPGAIRAAIEKEIRTTKGNQWRCAAVMRDPRNMARIRVACRDEKEQEVVKQAAEKAKVQGTRVLRDQIFPVKVDGVNRCAILDENSQLRPDIANKLGKENDVHIAKLAWLSKKDNQKAYGSMVIYVTKGNDARRLLQDQFFHVAGESGWTSVFTPFSGPTQCYNCQEIGHKAFNCKKTQVCGKCAKEGHHHKDCIDNALPKCVPCGGPHESFSRSCRVLYPRSNE